MFYGHYMLSLFYLRQGELSVSGFDLHYYRYLIISEI